MSHGGCRRPGPWARAAASVALLGALGVPMVACGEKSKAEGPADPNATVARVVDGDTIVADVRGTKERVRLIGIDTPESVKPDSPVECFGKEASAHAKELLPEGTPVLLVLDTEERDRYGRLLAYVYRAEDRRFINLAMVEDGYANQYTFPPNVAHAEEFRAAASKARSEGIGLWSACRENNPFDD